MSSKIEQMRQDLHETGQALFAVAKDATKNGENIDALQDKTSNMVDISAQFAINKSKLKSSINARDCKRIFLVALAIIGIALLAIGISGLLGWGLALPIAASLITVGGAIVTALAIGFVVKQCHTAIQSAKASSNSDSLGAY